MKTTAQLDVGGLIHTMRFWAAFTLSLLVFLSGLASAAPPSTNCVLWLRADEGVSLDASGRVSAWSDLSGSGHSASQEVANARPLLVADVLNGKPVLRFDQDYFHITGQVLTSQKFAVFAVASDTSVAGLWHREILSNWLNVNGTNSFFFGTSFGNPIRARITDYFEATGIGAISAPTTHFILSGISGASDAQLYQNRTLLGAKGSPLPSALNLTSPYVIGRQGEASEFWVGDIAEILVYNAELSTAERLEVWKYLEEKYFTPLDVSIHPAVEIGWNSESNVRYQLQWSSQLAPDTWFELGPAVTGNGARQVIYDSTRENSRKFYRIQILP